ncbi:MAG: ABC transporter ATP-binding protein [Actinomycetaceae bacterium]|nr:ABC transporter ATP-binding protein [Actinomycetaceae bacterium]
MNALTRPHLRNRHTHTNREGATVPALATRNLNKKFGSVHAVNNVSITVDPGEVVALLGPNGAGKSTTLDCALGLLAPDSGSSAIFGMKPREAIRCGLVGVVQQNDALLDEMNVKELITFVSYTYRQHRAVEEVMEWTGITHLAKRRAVKCSGGEKQRIRLAIGLLPDPLLLLLDEPTTGMDVKSRGEFWQFISEQAELGRAIMFATHYLAEAQEYAERTIIIRDGAVIADQNTDDLRRMHAGSTLRISYSCSDEEVREALEGARGELDWIVQTDHGELVVRGRDLDDAARAALALPGAQNLELTESSLEDAYTALINGEHAS